MSLVTFVDGIWVRKELRSTPVEVYHQHRIRHLKNASLC
ncbi:MAG: hypothetical protein ACI9V8_001239 [Urechidicola sp.]|jgi:hypothetical protein